MKHFIKRVRNYVKRRYRSYKDKPIKTLIGMTSMEERAYWKNYAAKIYTGAGAIVDLGCWFGSTTYSLAEGLTGNKRIKRDQKKIYAYDLFLWEAWMDPFVKGTKWDNSFQHNDSFLPVFNERISKYKNYVVTRPADLTKEKWGDGAIEFLLVDAMKSWELLNAIQKNFYPFLIPGKSIVLHQDFCHYYTYWIHLLNYRFRSYFEPADDKNFGSSMAFRLLKSIPEELLSKTYSLQDFSTAEIEEAFAFSLSLVEPVSKGAVLASKIMCYKERDGNEVAATLLKQAKADGVVHYDLDTVTGLL